MRWWRYDENEDDEDEDNDDDGDDDDNWNDCNSGNDGNYANDDIMMVMMLDGFDDDLMIPLVSDDQYCNSYTDAVEILHKGWR